MNRINPVLKPVDYSSVVNHRCLKANIALVEKNWTKNGWGGYLHDKIWRSFETGDTYHGLQPRDLKVKSGVVHSAGYYVTEEYITKPVHWRDQTWNVLPLYDKTQGGSAAAISLWNNSVYIGGSYEPKKNWTVACVWIDGILHDLQQEDEAGRRFDYSRVDSIFAAASGYYATGSVIVRNRPVIGYWLDGIWHTAEQNGMIYGNARLIALKAAPDDVILAGTVDASNVASPGYWINGKWHGVENPSPGANVLPLDLAVRGKDIIMCGSRTNEYGDAAPGYWLNDDWHFLGVPDNKIARQGCANRIGILDGGLLFGGYVYDERYDRQFPCVWEDESLITIATDSPNHAQVTGLDF